MTGPLNLDTLQISQINRIGDKGIRTPGLTGAIRALYQLSYIPILVAAIYDQINYSEIFEKSPTCQLQIKS
jgi:hypothetical protein